jgi:hypothetical protein
MVQSQQQPTAACVAYDRGADPEQLDANGGCACPVPWSPRRRKLIISVSADAANSNRSWLAAKRLQLARRPNRSC